MLLLYAIYFSTQIINAISFALTYEDLKRGIPLPHQKASVFHANTLVRISEDGTLRERRCPYPSVLDRKEAVCKFPEEPPFSVAGYSPDNFVDIVSCDRNQRNTQITYRGSCRMYVNCNCYGIGFVMECPKFTLFNNRTKQCVLPLQAECCEFPARNSDSVIVSRFV